MLLLSNMGAETEQFRLLEASLALTAEAAAWATDIVAIIAAPARVEGGCPCLQPSWVVARHRFG
jgi:hypothetical protein